MFESFALARSPKFYQSGRARSAHRWWSSFSTDSLCSHPKAASKNIGWWSSLYAAWWNGCLKNRLDPNRFMTVFLNLFNCHHRLKYGNTTTSQATWRKHFTTVVSRNWAEAVLVSLAAALLPNPSVLKSTSCIFVWTSAWVHFLKMQSTSPRSITWSCYQQLSSSRWHCYCSQNLRVSAGLFSSDDWPIHLRS